MIRLMASVLSPADARIAADCGATMLDLPDEAWAETATDAHAGQGLELCLRRPVDKAPSQVRGVTVLLELPPSAEAPALSDRQLAAIAAHAAAAPTIVAFEPGHLSHPGLVVRLADAGCTGILLDTERLARPRLLDNLTLVELRAALDGARSLGLRTGLGGALEAPDLPRLKPLAPDFLRIGRLSRDNCAPALDGTCLREMAGILADHAPDAATTTIVAGGPDRIIVEGLVVEMEIGAYAREQGRRQRVRFDVVVELSPRASRADDMRDVFSYDIITDAVAELTSSGHVVLVETLAEELAIRILREPRARRTTIRVTKLDLGPAAVGIEITRLGSRP
jgi:dihydroneopterin aldolase